MKIKQNGYMQYVLFGAALLLIPTLSSLGILTKGSITLVAGVLIYGIVSLGMNLLLGYSGLISLGTAGFMGLAAYLSGYVYDTMHLGFFAALVIVVLVSLVIGIIVGLLSLRIEGLYLAIATLAVSEILRKTFEEFEQITNGFSGLSITRPFLLLGRYIKIDTNVAYYIIVILLVVILVLTHNIINSHTGRALLTMRGSESAAQAMGISLLKYRLISFTLATVYAAIGGVLYMTIIRYSYPSTWILPLSLNIIAVVVVGGLRSIWGTMLGAFIIFGLPDLVLKQLPYVGKISGFSYMFSGVLIIVIVLFYPNGLIHFFVTLKQKFMKPKEVKQ